MACAFFFCCCRLPPLSPLVVMAAAAAAAAAGGGSCPPRFCRRRPPSPVASTHHPVRNGTPGITVASSQPRFLMPIIMGGLLSSSVVRVLAPTVGAACPTSTTFLDGSLAATNSLGTVWPVSMGFLLAEIDSEAARLITAVLGPILSCFTLLFVVRIVMSWYPQLPVEKFPYVIAYVPTEPVLAPTRRLLPAVGGVDISPVVWVAIVSFLNEALLGQQGLLVLLSQQQL